ncbi:sensor histidine kinase [Methanocella conradii]|uniref:sensor histidine kinase n=1 Tax=Methanocella conradii TaxID=1175444 RepID=UPI00157CAACA|nr:HAMP domain-containing sensor histidine kinase [Methanocella conradii]
MVSLKGSSRLIDKVMKLRRLKSKELILEQVDICSVLSRLKDKYSHLPGRNVDYTPSAECLVVANELIDEIFINLIENSIKHSPVDRPLIIDILQTMAREDGKAFIRVTIEDNGPGIPDDEKEKLFTRFYGGKTLAKGKGLGLYLVKTLAENFGGKIKVEDRVPGDYTKGVRFIVMLPAARK